MLIHTPFWVLTQAVYRQATTNSHREWQYHMLHVYNCVLLKMRTWGSKHVEENSILWINNNQCIKLVINIESILHFVVRCRKVGAVFSFILRNKKPSVIALFVCYIYTVLVRFLLTLTGNGLKICTSSCTGKKSFYLQKFKNFMAKFETNPIYP